MKTSFQIPDHYKTLSGGGVKPTIPIIADMQPWDVNFLPTDLLLGQWAYNADDKIYYQRISSGIVSFYNPDFKKGISFIDQYDPTFVYQIGDEVAFSDETHHDYKTPCIYKAKVLALQGDSPYNTPTKWENIGEYSDTLAGDVNIMDLIQTTADGLEHKFTSQMQQSSTQISQSVRELIYGDKGLYESVQSLIKENADSITLSVNQKIWGDNSDSGLSIKEENEASIAILADKISLTVTKDEYDELTGRVTRAEGRIDVTANKISIVVDAGDKVIGSILVTAINGQSEVKIAANNIQIDGTTTFSSGYNPNTAQQAADAAASSAATATTKLNNIANDNLITDGEKTALKLEVTKLQDEYPKILAQGNNYGYFLATETTNYTNAYSALITYLGTIPTYCIKGSDTIIVRSSFTDAFLLVYSTRQALLKAISILARSETFSAAQTANDAYDTAYKAYNNADALVYIKTALKNNTRIEGGLLSTTLIKVGAVDSGGVWQEKAGINGAGTGDNTPRFYAGGTLAQAISVIADPSTNNSMFVVTEGGQLIATSAIISGSYKSSTTNDRRVEIYPDQGSLIVHSTYGTASIDGGSTGQRPPYFHADDNNGNKVELGSNRLYIANSADNHAFMVVTEVLFNLAVLMLGLPTVTEYAAVYPSPLRKDVYYDANTGYLFRAN